MTEEHDLPTEKPAEESPQVKQARLWLHLDKVAYKIEEAAKELRAEASSDDVPDKPPVRAQIHAAENAHVNINRLTVPRDPLSITVAVLLALSLVVNVWCGWVIRDVGTRKWLHDYDLNQFQMGEFRQLQREVDLDHALIEQQCKR